MQRASVTKHERRCTRRRTDATPERVHPSLTRQAEGCELQSTYTPHTKSARTHHVPTKNGLPPVPALLLDKRAHLPWRRHSTVGSMHALSMAGPTDGANARGRACR